MTILIICLIMLKTDFPGGYSHQILKKKKKQNENFLRSDVLLLLEVAQYFVLF